MGTANAWARLFLWPGQAVYAGPGVDTGFHAHHAVQIGLSLDAPFTVRTGVGGTLTAQDTFVAWPGVPHEVACAGARVIFIWLEVPDRSPPHGRAPATRLPEVPGFNPTRARLHFQTISQCADARDLIAAATNSLLARPEARSPGDARLRAALALMRDPAIFERDHPIDDLARSVQLSASRLRHLFRLQMGLALQRYLLWRRLIVAVRALTEGADLTRSAHTAGFADSAHFSRTFRRMFGVPPSLIFHRSHGVQAHLCDLA